MFGLATSTAFKYISGTLGIILIGVIIYYKVNISSLESDIEKLEGRLVVANKAIEITNEKLGVCKANTTTLRGSIEAQNTKIKAQAIDAEKASGRAKIAKLKLAKALKELKEVKSNECSDIKESLDAISTIKYTDI